MWLSTSGTYSAYQTVTSSTLSNFMAEALGYNQFLSFPGSFNISANRRYALIGTLDAASNVILRLADEGSIASATNETPQTVGAPLPGARQGTSDIRFEQMQ